MKPLVRMSVVKRLALVLGGHWAYRNGGCGWYCDDGRRLVRVWNGDDGDNGHTEYWLYHSDKAPERGERYLYANAVASDGLLEEESK